MVAAMRLKVDAVEWREFEGEVVALDVVASEYLSANKAGAVLWRELAGGATREQLTAALASRFSIDETAAAGDVDRFLTALRSRDLLDE